MKVQGNTGNGNTKLVQRKTADGNTKLVQGKIEAFFTLNFDPRDGRYTLGAIVHGERRGDGSAMLEFEEEGVGVCVLPYCNDGLTGLRGRVCWQQQRQE